MMSRRGLCGIAIVLAIAAAALGDDDPLFAGVSDIDLKRVPAYTVAPEYPRRERRDRIEGEVQVCFDIDREGRPRRIAVRNSTHRAFEKPSMRAIRASTFRPLKDDEPLQSMKACRTFRFTLQPVEK